MKRLLVALSLLLLAVPAHAEGYPSPDGYVLDQDSFLSPGVQTRLERQLADYDRRTTNQVAVALLHSFDGMTPEDYGLGLFNAWGVGTAAKNNGVLLVLAVDDRESRLQVGKGLEEVLTDGEAQTVLDDVVAPAAREGDLDAAVVRAVAAVRAQLGETPVTVPAAPAPKGTVFRGGTSTPTYADDVVDSAPVGDPVDGPPFSDGGPTDGFPTVSPSPGLGAFFGFAALGLVVVGALAVAARVFGGSGGSPRGGPWPSDDDSWSAARRTGFLGGAFGSGAFGNRHTGSGWSSGSSSSGSSDLGSSGSSGGSSFGGGSSDGGGASGSW